MYTDTIPVPQNIQNDFKAGMAVVPPIAKAIKSVRDVMVMETPEWLITSPIFLSMLF